MGMFQANTWVAAVAATGVILSAGYALWLYRRVVMGDLIKESLKSITDMNTRERAIFAPLIIMTILSGCVSSAWSQTLSVHRSPALLSGYDTALADFAADSDGRRQRRPLMQSGDLSIILPEIVLSVFAMVGSARSARMAARTSLPR